MEKKAFNPADFVRNDIKFRGGTNEYLEAKWAVVWLRHEYPRANIETNLLSFDPDPANGYAVVRAVVELIDADGQAVGSATGIGSETAKDFKDYFEKADTKAIRRALNHLGFSKEMADPDSAVDIPYTDPSGTQASTRQNAPQTRPVNRQEATPQQPSSTPPGGTDPSWGDLTKPPAEWTGRAAFWKKAIDDYHAGLSKSTPEQVEAQFKQANPPQAIVDYFTQQALEASERRRQAKAA